MCVCVTLFLGAGTIFVYHSQMTSTQIQKKSSTTEFFCTNPRVYYVLCFSRGFKWLICFYFFFSCSLVLSICFFFFLLLSFTFCQPDECPCPHDDSSHEWMPMFFLVKKKKKKSIYIFFCVTTATGSVALTLQKKKSKRKHKKTGCTSSSRKKINYCSFLSCFYFLF